MSDDLVDLVIQEVVALHDFFGVWLRPGGGSGVEPPHFERSLAPGFRLIGPDGSGRDRATIVAWLHSMRGSRGADFRMAVSGFREVWSQGDAILLEYVETQYLQGKTTKRQSAALLCRAPWAPIGIAWLHLQETWLQDVA